MTTPASEKGPAALLAEHWVDGRPEQVATGGVAG